MTRLSFFFALLLAFALPVLRAQPQPIETVRLALQAPADLAVGTSTHEFAADTEPRLAFDLYRPAGAAADAKLPVVVFVSGANNVRNWAWFQDLSRLAVARGFAAIVPDKRYPRGWAGTESGYADTVRLLEHVRTHAAALGLDADRVALWTISGGGRLTSAGLRADAWRPRVLVNYYGLLDLDADLGGVADAARRQELEARYSTRQTWAALAADAPPFLVVRAGRDTAAINASIDRLAADALRLNLPLTLINLPAAVHGFDGWQHNSTSRETIAATFDFLATRLRAAP